MASSSRLDAKRPFWLVVLTLATFAALDTAIFRSGFYSTIASTKTVAGSFASVAHYRIAAPPSSKREVLVLGHSKVEAAFSAKQFALENPDSNLKFVYGTSGGTTEKMWYYLLKRLDPGRNRFAAVIVPQDQYKTPPIETDEENRMDVAQVLAPMLSADDWLDLFKTYDDPSVRRRVELGALVSSHFYALDVQDLLLHPFDRYRDLTWHHAVVATYLDDWPGYDGDLEDLVVDCSTGKIVSAPPHLDAFRRRETEIRFHRPPPETAKASTARYAAFRKEWLGRLVGLYERSETKLVFVQVPRWPFPMPALVPIEGAPTLTEFVRPSANVSIFDEAEFVRLEAPEYFYDVLHVNKEARRVFTHDVGARLRDLLHD